MANSKYRVDDIYLNQFRQSAKNDPWFALGELLGGWYGNQIGQRMYNRDMRVAGETMQAAEDERRRELARKNVQESGLINQNTYDLIDKAQSNWNDYSGILQDLTAKMDAYEGDKNDAEYKALAEQAEKARLGMDAAHNNAEQLRFMNDFAGYSNDGYLANDSLGEKLKHRPWSIMQNPYAPQGDPYSMGEGVQLNGGVLPQEKTLQAPTIADMANNALQRLSPQGTMTEDLLMARYLADPAAQAQLDQALALEKRDPMYWQNMKQMLRREGVSDAAIEDYLGGQVQGTAAGMAQDYYNMIANGDYLGADKLATDLVAISPETAQILKTGGVTVGNLFNTANANELAQRQTLARQQAEDTKYARQRADKAEDRKNRLQDKQWEIDYRRALKDADKEGDLNSFETGVDRMYQNAIGKQDEQKLIELQEYLESDEAITKMRPEVRADFLNLVRDEVRMRANKQRNDGTYTGTQENYDNIWGKTGI